ncbi:acyltransferase family protein [Nocardioides acrostichi]|uniref:Acyltransferase n=1 Tax=Nocardioides acrostichi TaxID=2784339 RepID=A0A930UZY6_9ACTN|nr:acyltransferase family protein [Nocardioides acrostichi]MBF4163998.1 acyltransferase [Nocardioides acrostichi]
MLADGSNKNDAVNLLRAVAAVAVLASHFRVLLFKDYDDVPHTLVNFALYGVTSLGHQAVIVFFVLSGFWVGGAVIRDTKRRRFSWSRYGTQRLIRLWLVLLPALVLTLILDRVGRALFPAASVYNADAAYHQQVVSEAPNDSVWDFLGNAAFLQTVHVPPLGSNTALWSIGFEFWFYVMFPLLALAVIGRGRWVHLAVLLAVCLFVGPRIVAYFPMWCMGVGVAMAARALQARLHKLGRLTLAAAQSAVGFAVLLAAVVARAGAGPLIVRDYGVAVVTTVLLVLLLNDFAIRREPSGGGLLGRASGYADSSYSLYAVHLPIVVFGIAVFGVSAGDRWASTPAHWVAYVALCLAVMLMAYVFSLATERQTTRVRRRFFALFKLSSPRTEPQLNG